MKTFIFLILISSISLADVKEENKKKWEAEVHCNQWGKCFTNKEISEGMDKALTVLNKSAQSEALSKDIKEITQRGASPTLNCSSTTVDGVTRTSCN